ncbi:MAG: hypothetical protein ACYDA8_24015 [Deferrisomatales bacterium]
MEACGSYKPWHDEATGKTFLRPDSGKCLHYYFYFLDAQLGLCYLRVPTWCPFRLQFYCNGHSWLERRLIAEGIGHTAADNAFVAIDDFARAQELADSFSPELLHAISDRYAELCCPVLDVFGVTYHWSLMQVEYATDLVFRSEVALGPLYEQLSRQAVLAVKAEHVSSFLGKKLTPQLAQEIGSRLSTRIEGTCIKHRLGVASVKIYDKFKDSGIVDAIYHKRLERSEALGFSPRSTQRGRRNQDMGKPPALPEAADRGGSSRSLPAPRGRRP